MSFEKFVDTKINNINAGYIPGRLSISASAGALTINLTDSNGSTPTGSTALSMPFRSSITNNGLISLKIVNAQTSFVISSGSTFGFTSAVAARLWIVAFDDDDGVRLGAINCRNGTDIYPLAQFGIASSTAEGGVGAADSAHVFYTNVAVTSKAYIILGYLEWPAGLTTAGTWTWTSFEKIQSAYMGMKLPGDVIQMKSNFNNAYSSTTLQIPIDNTIPQISEGSTVTTISFTPTSSVNILQLECNGQFGTSSAGSTVTVALFRSDVTNALSAIGTWIVTASSFHAVMIKTLAIINTTATMTLSARYGPGTAISATMNGSASGLYGAAGGTTLYCREIVA